MADPIATRVATLGPLNRGGFAEMTAIVQENIAALIYRQIKRKLMRGELAPGEALVLKPLVQEFSVSQTPVREALLQLVSEGVLESERSKPIRVPVLSPQDLRELRAIRLNLELMATAAAVPRITAAIIDRMESTHREMAQAKAQADRSGTLQKNFDFHFLLYEAAGMPILLGLLETLWARTGPSLRELYQPPFFHMPGEHPHLALLRALRVRDAAGALAAIQHDVAGHGEALMKRLEQHQAPATPV